MSGLGVGYIAALKTRNFLSLLFFLLVFYGLGLIKYS